jgi:hypothetical protein
MEAVDTAIVMLVVRVTVFTEKIPACVGTRPQVTRTTAKEAQKTGQWLSQSALFNFEAGFPVCKEGFDPSRAGFCVYPGGGLTDL